jgi:glycosyltransferase involved in cell wall biosynthesis
MKIAIYYNLKFGGAKRVVYEQVRGLVKLGNLVDVYTPDSESDIFDLTAIASNVKKYNFTEFSTGIPIFQRLINDFRIFTTYKRLHKKIASDINNEKYDIVLVHPDQFTQAPYLLRFLKLKSVYYCQEPLRVAYEYSMKLDANIGILNRVYENINRYIKKRADLLNVRSADFYLASCLHVRERMISAYNVFANISYPGVDSSIFKPSSQKKKNQIFFVGERNDPLDGFDFANSALALLPKDIRPSLKTISWNKDNSKRLSDEELCKIYNESLITLCMSRYETFGLVPLESMACGTAVIATNVGGHRETVVNNITGFLVEPNGKEISIKIASLLSDKKILKKYSEAARKHIEKNWSWSYCVLQLESSLKKFANHE